jgi:hypothetical protein
MLQRTAKQQLHLKENNARMAKEMTEKITEEESCKLSLNESPGC